MYAAFPASALHPAGPDAEALAGLTWILVAGATAIFTLLMVLALLAVFLPARRRPRLSSNAMILGGGVAFPVVVLSALLVYGVGLTGELRAPAGRDELRIELTGHMWWWEVRYPGAGGAAPAATANELRLPVGRPVALTLTSADVVHSFWVPSLGGKMDLIPGHARELRLRAARAGRYHGQCAEFCGAQHALMMLDVVALEPEEFDRWLADLRRPARDSRTDISLKGREAFLAQGCGNCHTVRGLVEGRLPAPDLTHVASRRWLGGGALRNTRENAIDWIARGEALKPGRAMPSFGHLDAATLAAIADYLAGLE